MDIDENRKQSEDNAGAENQDGDSNHGKLDDMIKDLSTSLWGVKNEQEYMQVYTNGEAKPIHFFIDVYFADLILTFMSIFFAISGPRSQSQGNQ